MKLECLVPWKVYHRKLRPQFSAVITEIQDRNGEAVIRWTGFDGMEKKKALAIAKLIVNAVNSYEKKEAQ
jgi:hypothetical protein